MTCPYSCKVWFGSRLSLNITNIPNPDFREWLYETILNKDEQIIIQTATIIYNLWHARNLSIFEGIMLPEDTIIQRASKCVAEYKSANLAKPSSPAAVNS
jgi:hypothetical protein